MVLFKHLFKSECSILYFQHATQYTKQIESSFIEKTQYMTKKTKTRAVQADKNREIFKLDQFPSAVFSCPLLSLSDFLFGEFNINQFTVSDFYPSFD